MISILARLRPTSTCAGKRVTRGGNGATPWKFVNPHLPLVLTVQNKGNSFRTAYSVGLVPVFEFVYVIHANSEDPSERDGIESRVNASLALRFIVDRATNLAEDEEL